MKITSTVPTFQPINLLIESEAEIKLLANLVACVNGAVSEAASGDADTAYAVWQTLRRFADSNITTKIDVSLL